MSKNTVSASATGLPSTPINEEPKRASSEQLADAYGDLESSVLAIKNMATVLETVVEKNFGDRASDESGSINFRLTTDQFDCFHFAVMHLGAMIRDLHSAYYQGYEGKGDSDR